MRGTSLEVQWLRFRASTAGDTGSIPGLPSRGTKIQHSTRYGKKKKSECVTALQWTIPLCLNFDFLMLVVESIKITSRRETLAQEECFSKSVLNMHRSPREGVVTLKMKKSLFTRIPRLSSLKASFYFFFLFIYFFYKVVEF